MFMSNLNRKLNIFIDAVPSKNYDGYETFEKNILQSITPSRQQYIEKIFKRARLSLEAQEKSNCGYLTETTLRHFLFEFNKRAWDSGLHSMPYMFNIMEAYFKYHKSIIYFELLEEEDYLISIYDFIDYVTSNKFIETPDKITDHLSENIIYNYNITDNKSLTFKSDDNNEFIISGISIVRRENEIVVTMIAGRQLIQDENIYFDGTLDSKENKDKEQIYKEYEENLAEGNIIYEFIDEENQFLKILTVSRFFLDDLSVDCHYIAEEYNKAFRIFTDDTTGIEVAENGKVKDEKMREFVKESVDLINKYNPIFEIAKLSLFLPFYLNENEDLIDEESINTEFKKITRNPLNKKKYNTSIGNKASIKTFYKLDAKNNFSLPDSILVKEDFFKISQKGVWRNFEDADKIGLDNKGNPVKGKTWITINESWYEYSKEEVVIQSNKNNFTDPDSGFIYMVRNPSFAENIFKIGLTRKNVDERVKQLSNTSVPDKYQIIKRWNVKNCIEAEKRIHKLLVKYRINDKREFFHIDSEFAIEIIQLVIEEINNN